MKKYNKVLVAGTFDRLHQGHKTLLETAINSTSNELIIAITDDSMVTTKKLHHLIESVDTRLHNIKEFITKTNVNNILIKYIIIKEKYSISIVDEDLNALVLSNETLQAGLEINQIRKIKGLGDLELIQISRTEISSTMLRELEYNVNIKN
jgi:cytidyltransferase-like protein